MRARYAQNHADAASAHQGPSHDEEEDAAAEKRRTRARPENCIHLLHRRCRSTPTAVIFKLFFAALTPSLFLLLVCFPRNQRGLYEKLLRSSSPSASFPEKNRCAILLHGSPPPSRVLTSVLVPALRRNVILPNRQYGCDYFVHISNWKEAENNDVSRQLKRAITDIHGINESVSLRITKSTRSQCFRRRRELFLDTHFLQDDGGTWIYFPDLIESWDGLDLAWELMESHQRQSQQRQPSGDRMYKYVGVACLDRVTIHPMDVYDGASEYDGPTIAKGNSIAYGSYEAMKIWATSRFDSIGDHLIAITRRKNGVGMDEDEFMQKMILPILQKRGFSTTRDARLCSLKVSPEDESISLKGCVSDSAKRTKRSLENIIGFPCAPWGASHCVCDREKYLLWELAERRKKRASSFLSWFLPNRINNGNSEAVVCCIVSNEELYIDEWLDYHLGIGFSHIYIYDNTDNFELSQGWLDHRPRLYKKVTLHHFPGNEQQSPAYQDCGSRYARHHRWVGFFDVDEFLVLRKHANVVDFLLQYVSEGGQISMNQERMSWSDQLQFGLRPVTQRFQGEHDVFKAVKSIANVDSLADSDHHPHFAKLKHGARQIDTNEKAITSDGREDSKAWNFDYPSDVATFYHYHTKSWKEYIYKRMRGRADQASGDEKRVFEAKAGVGLQNTTREDSLAWDTLKSVSPKYQFFDSNDPPRNQSPNISSGICCYVNDQEAYIDEWVSYHLAMGFTAIYIYDSSKQFWMQQWGEASSRIRPVYVTHTPGNVSHPHDKASAFTNCTITHGNEHDSLVFMEVNDFFMFTDLTDTSPINAIVSAQPGCAHQYRRVYFGTSGNFLFDPVPVTKSFLFRVNNRDNRGLVDPPPLLLVTSAIKEERTTEMLQKDFGGFLDSSQWNSDVCPSGDANTLLSAKKTVGVYHYLHSTKECQKQRGKSSPLCAHHGIIEDHFGWDQLQRFLPEYSVFNGFL